MSGLSCLHDYGLKSRKNICEPEMGLVMTFCPLMTIGAVELVSQNVGKKRLVANSKVKAVALVG
jgi:hypothetical protein